MSAAVESNPIPSIIRRGPWHMLVQLGERGAVFQHPDWASTKAAIEVVLGKLCKDYPEAAQLQIKQLINGCDAERSQFFVIAREGWRIATQVALLADAEMPFLAALPKSAPIPTVMEHNHDHDNAQAG